MAAQVVKRLPEGDDWIYELKFDGYRALTIKDEQRGELLVGLLGLRPPSGSRHAATNASESSARFPSRSRRAAVPR